MCIGSADYILEDCCSVISFIIMMTPNRDNDYQYMYNLNETFIVLTNTHDKTLTYK